MVAGKSCSPRPTAEDAQLVLLESGRRRGSCSWRPVKSADCALGLDSAGRALGLGEHLARLQVLGLGLAGRALGPDEHLLALELCLAGVALGHDELLLAH